MKEIDLTTTSWPVVNYNNKYELTTIIRSLAEESKRNSEIVEESINELNREVEDIETAIGDMKYVVSIEYNDLVELRNNSELVPGAWYRIIDYTTTTVQEETQSAGHDFDVIVLSLSENTLSEEARSCKRDGDTYFTEAGARLEAWKLWYSLDNNTDIFAWADENNGKGVIYRMIDEWNNDLPYDFKNIQFKRDKSKFADKPIYNLLRDGEVYYYTFDNNGNDATLQKLKVYINKIGNYIVNNRIKLNDSIFIGNDFYYNTIGNDFNYNTIGNNFYSNTIGNNFYSNTIGNDFNSNTIGNDFYSNTIGNDFYSNTICDYFNYNTIGNDFYYNTIGNYFYSNTIGYNFNSNTIGNYFYSNTIGYNFNSNTIGNNCYFLYSTDRDYPNDIKYLYIKDGTIGTSEPNKLRIDETGSGASNDTPRTILKTKTGKFIVEYYDDLDKKIAYKEVGTETNWTVNS